MKKFLEAILSWIVLCLLGLLIGVIVIFIILSIAGGVVKCTRYFFDLINITYSPIYSLIIILMIMRLINSKG